MSKESSPIIDSVDTAKKAVIEAAHIVGKAGAVFWRETQFPRQALTDTMTETGGRWTHTMIEAMFPVRKKPVTIFNAKK